MTIVCALTGKRAKRRDRAGRREKARIDTGAVGVLQYGRGSGPAYRTKPLVRTPTRPAGANLK
jgi:hypothetical protein